MGSSVGIGIDRDIGKTTERAQIIQTTHMVIVFVCHQYAVYLLKEEARSICSLKSGPQSINITASSVCSRDDARKRLSRGSVEVQTGQVQPISGTPVEVPLPNILSFPID